MLCPNCCRDDFLQTEDIWNCVLENAFSYNSEVKVRLCHERLVSLQFVFPLAGDVYADFRLVILGLGSSI